jgi:hypothetical protein
VGSSQRDHAGGSSARRFQEFGNRGSSVLADDRVLAIAVVVLFASSTPLSFWSANAPRGADWRGPLLAVAVALSAGLVVLSAMKGRFGWLRASFVSAVILLCFFNWRLVGAPINRLFGVHRDVAPLFVLLVLLAVGFVWGNRKEPTFALLAMGIVMVALSLVSLGLWYLGDKPPLPTGAADLPVVPGIGPDVHVLVFDGYGRSDVLEAIFRYDNSDLENGLEENGFTIPSQSRANFTTSAASISSAWLGQPVVAAADRLTDRERLVLHRVLGGENPIVGAFQEAGYRYVHIEGGWIGSKCGPNVDECRARSILDEAMWALVERSAMAWWFETNFGHSFSYNGIRALENLIELEKEDTSGGKLVFTHVVLPHPPLLVDADCQIAFEPDLAGQGVGMVGASAELVELRRAGYSAQVECVNSQTLNLVAELEDDDIVVMFGDHGPDSLGQLVVEPSDWEADQILERFAIFAAIRMPGCESDVPEDWSPVDGLRLVLGCLADEQLRLNEPSSFIFPMDGSPGTITEVSVPDG